MKTFIVLLSLTTLSTPLYAEDQVGALEASLIPYKESPALATWRALAPVTGQSIDKYSEVAPCGVPVKTREF